MARSLMGARMRFLIATKASHGSTGTQSGKVKAACGIGFVFCFVVEEEDEDEGVGFWLGVWLEVWLDVWLTKTGLPPFLPASAWILRMFSS